MTSEEVISVLNDYDINFERNTPEEVAEAHEMAIKALEQKSCEDCCNGNQEEKAKLCQKSYIAGMEHNCENEQIIRIKKGTLKARTGKYVVYDAEWLKEHFNTTEAKIYGQPNEDCISRKAAIDALWKALHEYEDKTEKQFLESKELDVADWFQHRIFVQNMSDIDRQTILNLPSATPQQKTGHWIEHKHGGIEHIECSKCRCWFLRKDLIRNSYCPNCGSRNHWNWELKLNGGKKE